MEHSLSRHKEARKLQTLVENRTIYAADYSELNIFETHTVAHKVALTFDFPVIASMLTGKKIMHLDGLPEFDFLPGESVVMPTGETMVIDFPIATKESPTQCLALGIDPTKISEVASRFNEAVAIEKYENNNWQLENGIASHLTNQAEVNYLVDRLVRTFTKDNVSKDALIDLMIQELIIRLLQTKARTSILTGLDMFSDTRIGSVVKFIKENLTDSSIDVDTLAKKACMSSSNFYKKFKNTLGVSPVDFMNAEKIKFAKRLMKTDRKLLIAEVAYKSGFNNVSYFNRQFKRLELMTPQQFKKSIMA